MAASFLPKQMQALGVSVGEAAGEVQGRRWKRKTPHHSHSKQPPQQRQQQGPAWLRETGMPNVKRGPSYTYCRDGGAVLAKEKAEEKRKAGE